MAMEVKSRREEYAEATCAAIVEAAVARFTADGFAGANIDSIAEMARVTKGAVYHHFADKAQLFEAAYVAMEDRLLARVLAGIKGIDDPWEALLLGADVFLEGVLPARLQTDRPRRGAGGPGLGPLEGKRGEVLPRTPQRRPRRNGRSRTDRHPRRRGSASSDAPRRIGRSRAIGRFVARSSGGAGASG